jgi:transaldolase / glucose-6-phosphate isomerase
MAAPMTDTTAAASAPLPRLALGEHEAAYAAAVARARDEGWAERLFDRDPTLWSANERVQAAIAERLGWLDAPIHFSEQIAALEGFGEGIRDAGFTTAVVGGMGGSSLAPEVFVQTFGTAEGWLDLRVLDSTDPAAVAATVDDLDPLATLWIVASKSGTTTEPLAFQADAWDRAERALRARNAPRNEHAGELMIAITDPGRSVEAIPHHDELREVFLNPPDIGGRYSALTYVGLVPASLIGLDLDAMLASAIAMMGACRDPEPEANPGLSLGLAIGTLAKAGRDKLTLLADPAIASFGSWLEQLLAESTGKHGTGIVPVDREPLGDLAAYGTDRVFVRLTLAAAAGAEATGPTAGDIFADAAAAAGHPVIRIAIADPIDIGAEAFRWEVATAIAGAVLGIDPFDQPNVEEAKDLTRKVLAGASAGETPAAPPAPLVADAATGMTLHGDAALRLTGGSSANGESGRGTNGRNGADDAGATVIAELARHLARRKPNAYLALQAFIAPTPATDEGLDRIRALLRDETRCATTSGYGPRFLHSTGQLHKGGPATGWFLQLTSDHPVDRPIPGWPYTFGRLIDAQAEGDFAAIESHDLPILRVHLADPATGLAALEQALREALGRG